MTSSDDLVGIDILHHSHIDFVGRAWDLPDNITAYDAMYVALAEAMDAPLVTCDGPLGATHGRVARIDVIR
jgi:predicted nucleic acid-binding protein